MRDFRHKQAPVPRPRLARGADGRLKSSAERDIADVWADVDRIKLNHAMKKQQKKVEKQAGRELNLSISLPKLRLPKLPKLSKARKKRLLVSSGLATSAVVLLALSFNLYGGGPANDAAKKQDDAPSTGVLQADTGESPDFPTILPVGKVIQDFGGWAKVSPAGSAPAFAYIDSIKGVRIRVSEQQLPDTFKPDTDGKVAELANQYSAQEKLFTGSTDAYIGVSTNGIQSVIYSKAGLLILIKSDGQIANSDWTNYLTGLQ